MVPRALGAQNSESGETLPLAANTLAELLAKTAAGTYCCKTHQLGKKSLRISSGMWKSCRRTLYIDEWKRMCFYKIEKASCYPVNC